MVSCLYPASHIYGSTLKWIAMATMIIDHVAAVVLMPLIGMRAIPSEPAAIFAMLHAGGMPALCLAMRLVGRLAFPIFCFLLVEGMVHTRSRARYLRNLLLCALASEVPFDLCVQGTAFSLDSANTLWTLALGLVACVCFDRLKDAGHGILPLAAVFFMAAVAWFFETDYEAYGVLLVVLLYCFRRDRQEQCMIGGIASLASAPTAWLAFIPCYFYNGQRGRQPKWLFYAFYPLHLLLLYALRLYFLGI